MIFIKFDPPTHSQEWNDWVEECKQAQKDLNEKIAKNEEVKIKGALYGKLKESIYIPRSGQFWGKCAFCEEVIVSSQHGDIEHFRPKGGVKDENNKPILGADGQPHPGYYWLAYDYTNFLPSCQLCNQPSTGRSNGERIGKWNAFPLAPGTARATKEGEEKDEKPLLINPTIDDPSIDLGFDPLSGALFEIKGSERGRACIDIFGLNDRDLPDRRREKYDDVKAFYIHMAIRKLTGANIDSDLRRVDRILSGYDEYAMVGRRALIDGKREAIEGVSVIPASPSTGPT